MSLLQPQARSAIIGAGFIGHVHARAIRAAGGELVAVADRDMGSAAAAAGTMGATDAYPDALSLIENADVDVVHICVPNDLHVQLTLAALAAGKNVVCEKPVATTLADAKSVQSAAHRLQRLVAVPFVYRYHPVVRHAQELIARGDLGAVTLIHGSYLQDWLLRETDSNWRVDPDTGGASRAFADIGSHWCDLVQYVTEDSIMKVSAMLRTVQEKRSSAEATSSSGAVDEGQWQHVTTEDIAVASMVTRRGALVNLTVSQVSPGRKNRLWFEIDGTEASVVFNQERPDELLVGRREVTELIRRDPLALLPGGAALAYLPAGHAQGYQDCFNAFIADVYQSIRSDEPVPGLPTIDHGVAAVALTEAVLASHAAAAWTNVSYQ